MSDKPYGLELILDLHNCNPLKFNRRDITNYFEKLCILIDMDRGDLHFWDYEGDEEEYAEAPPHLKGTSAIQFIYTSNITIHTLDDLKSVYLNIFSCKIFDPKIVMEFTANFFEGNIVHNLVVERA